MNTTKFVLMHELAHVMTVTTHHTKEFWDNFAKLLKAAEELGLYRYEAYHKTPKKFCETTIHHTPYIKKV